MWRGTGAVSLEPFLPQQQVEPPDEAERPPAGSPTRSTRHEHVVDLMMQPPPYPSRPAGSSFGAVAAAAAPSQASQHQQQHLHQQRHGGASSRGRRPPSLPPPPPAHRHQRRRHPSAPPLRPTAFAAAAAPAPATLLPRSHSATSLLTSGCGGGSGGGSAASSSLASYRVPPRRPANPAAAAAQPRPGSASASAAQVEALLTRLSELEQVVATQHQSEEQLKEVNLKLMARLRDFQDANDANVEQAEAELTRLHHALRREQAARAEAEMAVGRATAVLADERGDRTHADHATALERLQAGETAERLHALVRANAHTARARR